VLALKILTGQQMGKVIQLREGLSVLGRSPECDIIIANGNVSKRHASLEKKGDLIILRDLKSTNGCYVNGVKIQESKIHVGDKLSFHDTVTEVIEEKVGGALAIFQSKNEIALPTDIVSDLAIHIDDDDIIQPYDPPVEIFKKKTNHYFENTVLPGIYKLTEYMDFQWVVGFFFILVVVISTSLSVIPLLKILRESIEESSLRNVQNIVKEVVTQNKDPLFKRLFSAVDLDSTYQKQGVIQAYITDIRGEIVAPARFAGKTPKIPGFPKGRKIADNRTFIEFINSKNILAVEAFKYYDPKKSIESTRYYALVLYDVDTRMMDFNRTLSLFIQTLAVSLLVALILYFFVSRLISYPLRVLNRQVDLFLRNGTTHLETKLKFPILIKLYSNLNSALNRQTGAGTQEEAYEYDRNFEMKNIVELIGYAAVVIRASDETITAFNPRFEELTNLLNLEGTAVFNITDQSLKKNLQGLLEKIKMDHDQIQTDQLEFSGDPYELAMQSVYGNKEVAYYIVSIIPVERDS
jgi:hypothetical protein